MQEVIAELERLRRRARALLITQRAAAVLAWTGGTVIALVAIDYFLRLPVEVRLLLLLGGLGTLFIAVARYLIPTFGFRPDLTQLALRVERSMPALRGRLASSVEFVLGAVDQDNPLALRTVQETMTRLAGEAVIGIVRPARALRDLAVLICIVVLAISLIVIYPSLAQTGLARFLTPLGSAQWPARTAVVSLMHEVLEHGTVHPRGEALALRARNLTSNGEDEQVDVHYRLKRDGSFESWQRAVLTYQKDGVHERLIDTNAQGIDLYFATEDALTRTEHVRFTPRPAIERATLKVQIGLYTIANRLIIPQPVLIDEVKGERL